MASKKNINVDLNSVLHELSGQFRGLNTSEPGQWPWLPKAAAFLAVALAMVVFGWFLLLSSTTDELEAERAREPGLRQDYRNKLAQAVNLDELRKQKIQVQEYVTQLEKQLPGKAEMDALLSDINQAGLGRGLQFELFRPGQVAVKDYYAELPISIKVTGRYHDIGAFASDVANLSRIVTLHNLNITGIGPGGAPATAATAGTGNLSMDALARTYRYLDPAEVESQRKAKDAAQKAGAKK
ncbi:type 4a pilus biogenesis protein PilO [uncultured Methylibium sp.]|uniref:type 4a pilus biogenesis protein PilO n=1 Tax=uncultured Methylibium sp. TaxID=381093 RepID=UPI0025D2855D|nr:type 4a pilus biogenesis protein PilO [uncultured Methylibium sp.]